jgi:hypothetical protein
MSETPSESEVWVPERRTRVSRSSVMRGASVRAPLHRTRAGRGAPEGLPREARPRLGIGRRRRRCRRGRSRGARRTARQRRQEHGPDRDTPHGWVRTRGVLKKDSHGPTRAAADPFSERDGRGSRCRRSAPREAISSRRRSRRAWSVAGPPARRAHGCSPADERGVMPARSWWVGIISS